VIRITADGEWKISTGSDVTEVMDVSVGPSCAE
jgi:hypothetical protein